jgi:hypothetical protein
MTTIINWSVVSDNAPYLAPELREKRLQGQVYGHPHKENGSRVTTSSIVAVSGRKVTTRTGTTYHLGKIAKGYRKWLRKNRPNWNWRKPITMREA